MAGLSHPLSPTNSILPEFSQPLFGRVAGDVVPSKCLGLLRPHFFLFLEVDANLGPRGLRWRVPDAERFVWGVV